MPFVSIVHIQNKILHSFIFSIHVHCGGGVRVAVMWFCLIYGAVFAEIFILSCGIAALQNRAVCGIRNFSGNFNVVCCFLMLFCVVFIHNSVWFCSIRTPLCPPLHCITAEALLGWGCILYVPSLNFK